MWSGNFTKTRPSEFESIIHFLLKSPISEFFCLQLYNCPQLWRYLCSKTVGWSLWREFNAGCYSWRAGLFWSCDFSHFLSWQWLPQTGLSDLLESRLQALGLLAPRLVVLVCAVRCHSLMGHKASTWEWSWGYLAKPISSSETLLTQQLT